MARRTLGFIIVALLAWGCAVGPDYKRPALDTPPTFRGADNPATNSLAALPWWEVFQDDTLRDLIRQALTNNYDLRLAVSHVEQARAIAAEARSQFFPQLGYTGTATRGKNAILGQQTYTGTTANGFQVAGIASWEIDLWGRIRRLSESARAQYFASEEGHHDVLITVIGEVAQNYFQLLALDRQLEIAKATTNAFGGSLKIFSERLEQGTVSKLETSRAKAALASAAATVPDLERQIIFQENALNVLIGRNPGPIARRAGLLDQSVPPEVPAGLPAGLLERRPDIREAEQLLRSANARIGVAVADFFPKLSLTALFGQVSPELSTFTAGGANAWAFAANVAGPIFQGGRLKAEYRQAKAVRDQFELQYRQTVLNAFQEISSTLISRQKLEEIRAQQTIAVTSGQDSVDISTKRYLAGHASYFEVLEAQQQLFPAQNALVQTQLNQLTTIVQLYRALGGGWKK